MQIRTWRALFNYIWLNLRTLSLFSRRDLARGRFFGDETLGTACVRPKKATASRLRRCRRLIRLSD